MKQITFKTVALPINYKTNEIGNHDNDPAKMPLEVNVLNTEEEVQIIIKKMFDGFFEVMEKEIEILENISLNHGVVDDIKKVFNNLPKVEYNKPSSIEADIIGICITSKNIINYTTQQSQKIMGYIVRRSEIILAMFEKEFPDLDESEYDLPTNEQVMKILHDLQIWSRFLYVTNSIIGEIIDDDKIKSETTNAVTVSLTKPHRLH